MEKDTNTRGRGMGPMRKSQDMNRTGTREVSRANENAEGRMEGPREDRNLTFRDEFSKLFDQNMWLEPLDFFRRVPQTLGRIGLNVSPKVDVSETEKEVKVVAEMPGVNPDDVDIEVRDNWMIIKGK